MNLSMTCKSIRNIIMEDNELWQFAIIDYYDYYAVTEENKQLLTFESVSTYTSNTFVKSIYG